MLFLSVFKEFMRFRNFLSDYMRFCHILMELLFLYDFMRFLCNFLYFRFEWFYASLYCFTASLSNLYVFV